jgi:hypothetical protein
MFLMELPRHEMELVDCGEAAWLRQPSVAGERSELGAAPDNNPERARHAARNPKQASARGWDASLQTAADLLAERAPSAERHAGPGGNRGSRERVDPELFQVGMAVVHPTYGPGKVAALSGSGAQRTGTVQFATAGKKKFVLSKCPLRPVAR